MIQGLKKKKKLKHFFPQNSYHVHNSLGINMYKIFMCDKNQVPYCNAQSFKKWN